MRVKKQFAVIVLCVLMLSLTGVAAAEEEAWVNIKSVPQEYDGAPYIFAGSTNLPTGSVLKFNITSLVNGVSESGTVQVTNERDATEEGAYYWRFNTRLTEFPPGPCTITMIAESEHPDISDIAEFSLSDIWIKIDPLPFVAADMDNVTFSGTTTIAAGKEVLVEIINSDATTAGPFYGRNGIIDVQNGTDTIQTWNISINTTGLPPKEYIIMVYGIEVDRSVREYFMIYPAGYATPGPTTSLSPKEYWIKIDPIPFITADMGNVTISGTTTIPVGREVLVEIINTDGSPNGTNNLFGRSVVTTIQSGTDTIQTWNISINATTRLPPKEYRIVVYGIVDDVKIGEYFMTYPAGYTTPGPTKIPESAGFSIIATLVATAAALIFSRK